MIWCFPKSLVDFRWYFLISKIDNACKNEKLANETENKQNTKEKGRSILD